LLLDFRVELIMLVLLGVGGLVGREGRGRLISCSTPCIVSCSDIRITHRVIGVLEPTPLWACSSIIVGVIIVHVLLTLVFSAAD
jgi:hypothetical protein